MRIDGTEARVIGGRPDDADPQLYHDAVWSPDGRRIAYSGGSAISVVDADGADERHLVPADGELRRRPAWSPDGSQLAYSGQGRQEGAPVEVWRVGLDGSDASRVTTPPAGVQHHVHRWWIAPTSIAPACPSGQVPATGFDDVSGTHAEAIACATWHGVAQGRTTTTYEPAAPVRRDQIATFLARLLAHAGIDLPAPDDQGFTDIAGNRHADAINQLAELGVITGVTESRFAPAQPMTRAQMATLLVRTYELAAGRTLPRALDEFDDDNGSRHEASIDRAASTGFASGRTLSSYEPGGTVRRDQMATFLMRVVAHLVREGVVTNPR